MMGRAMHLAAAILPVIGLAALWGWSDHLSRQGTDWDVPVQGYDPRDLLRGHYVEFTYDWPGSASDEGEDGDAPLFQPAPQFLCLYGAAPALERVERFEEPTGLADCAHPARANRASVYGFGSLRRGRLYVGQDRAREIEELMRDGDQRGIVRIRQRGDGNITPISISFRPLNAQELAERDAQDDEVPPAIEIAPE